MNSVFWLENPLILFQQPFIMEFWPTADMCRSRKLNAIARLVIVMTIVGFIITRRTAILVSGFAAMGMTVVMWMMGKKEEKMKEGLEALKAKHVTFAEAIPEPKMTKPTKENPLMNVMLPQINEDPHRPPAEPAFVPEVEDEINSAAQDFAMEQFNNDPKIRDLLFSDLPERMTFDHSMRNFNANPSTTTPNDQTAFAQFCFGNAVSCKEGHGLACERNNYRKYPTV